MADLVTRGYKMEGGGVDDEDFPGPWEDDVAQEGKNST